MEKLVLQQAVENFTKEERQSILDFAIANKSINIIKFAIAIGADATDAIKKDLVEHSEGYKEEPTETEIIEAEKMLIDIRADRPHLQESYPLIGYSSGNYAQTEAFEITKILIEAGADVTGDNNFAIRYASKIGCTEIVDLLIKAGADVTANNNEAIRNASSNYVTLYADYQYVTRYRYYNYKFFAHIGYIEIVKLLIKAGADVTANDNEAIRMASKFGLKDVVKLLIEAGADVTAKNNEALMNALRYFRENEAPSASKNLAEIVKLLIEAGADVTVNNNEAIRKICEVNKGVAISKSCSKIVKLLIRAGADVTANDNEAIKEASKHCLKVAIKLLIKAGADVTANNNEALMNAIRYFNKDEIPFKNFIETVKLLIEVGADVTANDNEAIRIASRRCLYHECWFKDVIKLLIEAGADVTANNNEAIRCAPGIQTIEILIEAGADVTANDNESIKKAVKQGRYDSEGIEKVNFLIENGANITKTTLWNIVPDKVRKLSPGVGYKAYPKEKINWDKLHD